MTDQFQYREPRVWVQNKMPVEYVTASMRYRRHSFIVIAVVVAVLFMNLAVSGTRC